MNSMDSLDLGCAGREVFPIMFGVGMRPSVFDRSDRFWA